MPSRGIELDADLWRQSSDKIRKLGLEKNAHIVNGDLLRQNCSSADLVTVYLLPTRSIPKSSRCWTSN